MWEPQHLTILWASIACYRIALHCTELHIILEEYHILGCDDVQADISIPAFQSKAGKILPIYMPSNPIR
jgi:hypothetical protein